MVCAAQLKNRQQEVELEDGQQLEDATVLLNFDREDFNSGEKGQLYNYCTVVRETGFQK